MFEGTQAPFLEILDETFNGSPPGKGRLKLFWSIFQFPQMHRKVELYFLHEMNSLNCLWSLRKGVIFAFFWSGRCSHAWQLATCWLLQALSTFKFMSNFPSPWKMPFTGFPPSGKIRESQGEIYFSGKSGKVREFVLFFQNEGKSGNYFCHWWMVRESQGIFLWFRSINCVISQYPLCQIMCSKGKNFASLRSASIIQSICDWTEIDQSLKHHVQTPCITLL